MNPHPVRKNGHPVEPATLVINTPEAFREVTYHFGVLIPPHVAAKMADVTNQLTRHHICTESSWSSAQTIKPRSTGQSVRDGVLVIHNPGKIRRDCPHDRR